MRIAEAGEKSRQTSCSTITLIRGHRLAASWKAAAITLVAVGVDKMREQEKAGEGAE